MKLTLRFIAFCLVSSLLSHSSFGTTTDKEFSTADSLYIDLMGKADTAIAQNDWSQAESLLLTAMRSQPSNPANVLLLSNLAIIRFQQGNDSLALATINDAIIIAPNSVTALNNRARILKAIGDIDGAYADYEKIGARIIARDTGNWYHSFTIDKGSGKNSLSNLKSPHLSQ